MPFEKKVGWNRSKIDERTQKLASQVQKMAIGFTREQFETALILALEDADSEFVLSNSPDPQ